MVKFHVNPETGDVGKCSATFNCPYGDIDQDHYPTREEARKAFEERMEKKSGETSVSRKKFKTLGDPIIFTTSKPYQEDGNLRWFIDYDYESSYDHPEDEDICRCGTIERVEINGWRNKGEGLAEYIRIRLGFQRTPISRKSYGRNYNLLSRISGATSTRLRLRGVTTGKRLVPSGDQRNWIP